MSDEFREPRPGDRVQYRNHESIGTGTVERIEKRAHIEWDYGGKAGPYNIEHLDVVEWKCESDAIPTPEYMLTAENLITSMNLKFINTAAHMQALREAITEHLRAAYNDGFADAQRLGRLAKDG